MIQAQYGDPRLPDRYWDKVYPEPNTGCWLWGDYAASKFGHGQFRPGGRKPKVMAYRYSYEKLVAPIAAGLFVDHLCRTPACVNPDHLEPVTPAVNTRRGAAARTRCLRDHEFTPENTRRDNRGWRLCKTCDRLRQQARRSGHMIRGWRP